MLRKREHDVAIVELDTRTRIGLDYLKRLHGMSSDADLIIKLIGYATSKAEKLRPRLRVIEGGVAK